VGRQVLAPVADHHAPTRGGRRDTETEEAERRSGRDRHHHDQEPYIATGGKACGSNTRNTIERSRAPTTRAAITNSSWARLVDDTVTAYGALHTLVNNAVATIQRPDNTVADVDMEVWDETLPVNLLGPVLLCKVRRPIVNIGARTAVRGTPKLAAYSTSKAALHGLTRGRSRLRSQFCHAVDVAPTVILTKSRIREARFAVKCLFG
jgi:NAD(P)-dependent dehydrogenase (short-subunit alcohol dehydrogenase family)